MNLEDTPRENAHLVVPSRVEEATRVRKVMGALSIMDGFSDEDVIGIEIAVGEGVANAVRHGSPHGERDTIEVHYTHAEDQFVEIVITDRGTGFDLEQWLSEVKPLTLSDGQRGLLLIASLMDEVSYARSDVGGTLRMRKYASASSSGSHEASISVETRRRRPEGAGGGAAESVPRLRVA